METLQRYTNLQFFFANKGFLDFVIILRTGFDGFFFSSQEAVIKVFQRALQVCDPKKVYFTLLGMYERTEQDKLADELLEKMIKKFKHSCKVC